jgi:hypothetical protein
MNRLQNFGQIVFKYASIEFGLTHHTSLTATIFELVQGDSLNLCAKPFGGVTESICYGGTISFCPWASKQADNLHFTLPSQKAPDLFYVVEE